jgi:hypothetical protein
VGFCSPEARSQQTSHVVNHRGHPLGHDPFAATPTLVSLHLHHLQTPAYHPIDIKGTVILTKTGPFH